MTTLPTTWHARYGQILHAAGRGRYPYDCISRDRHPNAMIYHGDGCWSHQFASDFLNRDQTLDNLDACDGDIELTD